MRNSIGWIVLSGFTLPLIFGTIIGAGILRFGQSLEAAAQLEAAQEKSEEIASQGKRESGAPYLVREKEVSSNSTAGGTMTVFQLLDPEVRSMSYKLIGEVRYEGVEGKGYLEMLSLFNGKGEFFSRSLADFGPLKSLEGDSDWRAFELPFHRSKGTMPPTRITLNVVFPEKGKVWLRKVQLVNEKEATEVSNAWFDERTAGYVGGWLGTIFGIFGGLIGCVAGFLVPRGRGKGVVLGMLWFSVAIGAVLAVIGGFAFATGQPYHVFYPLLLVGLIEIVVCLPLTWVINRRFAEAELRKMEAMDAC